MNQPSGTLRSKDAVPAAFGVRAKNSMSDKDMVSLPASFFKPQGFLYSSSKNRQCNFSQTSMSTVRGHL